jgi:prophage antirepressor-like protein
LNNSNKSNQNSYCPIIFEDKTYPGVTPDVKNFTCFTNDNVRVVILNGRPYFSAVDLSRALYINARSARSTANDAIREGEEYLRYREASNTLPLVVNNISMDELYYMVPVPVVKRINRYSANYMTQMIPMLFVAEPIMYSLIAKSRRREASLFKNWMIFEVIPYLNGLGVGCTRLINPDTIIF